MRYLLVPFVLCAMIGLPAVAQDEGQSGDIATGVDLLSEGARTLLRGLMGKVDPEMQDLAEGLRNWNFEGLGIEDLGMYHPPEILPNGDIILRRKSPRDDVAPVPEARGDGEVDI